MKKQRSIVATFLTALVAVTSLPSSARAESPVLPAENKDFRLAVDPEGKLGYERRRRLPDPRLWKTGLAMFVATPLITLLGASLDRRDGELESQWFYGGARRVLYARRLAAGAVGADVVGEDVGA